jgi:hypothetical protein
MTVIASGMLSDSDEIPDPDSREGALNQLSVLTYIQLYSEKKQPVMARIAQEAGASNRQLACACGITDQTASKRFPALRRPLPDGTAPSGSGWRRRSSS